MSRIYDHTDFVSFSLVIFNATTSCYIFSASLFFRVSGKSQMNKFSQLALYKSMYVYNIYIYIYSLVDSMEIFYEKGIDDAQKKRSISWLPRTICVELMWMV